MPDIRRVFAGVSGSPGSVPALRQAADIARHHGAVLIPLHTWVPPEGDVHERKHPCAELRQLWEDDAWQRMREALDAAFGGLPVGITTQPVVLRGKPGPALTGAARQAGDLLIIGAGRRGLPRRLAGWVSAATAWPTPNARWPPSRPRRWPSAQATACAAERSGAAGSGPPPRPVQQTTPPCSPAPRRPRSGHHPT
jgi:nucleotide-binding universal stress UspA family protein